MIEKYFLKAATSKDFMILFGILKVLCMTNIILF